MRLLLDTHMLIWLAGERRKLSSGERAAIAQADELIVSALTIMELRVKMRAERRRGVPPSVFSPADAIAFCEARQIIIHPLTADDLAVVLTVDPSHGDPFDEVLLAHTQVLRARLLTRDSNLRKHPLAFRSEVTR